MKKFLRRVAQVYLIILFAVLLLSFVFLKQLGFDLNPEQILQSSSALHPLGTDSLGRDLLQRIIQGGQVSVSIGLLTTFLALLVGLVVGCVAGWYEGNTDRVLMRVVDIFISIPGFILVSVLCVLLQSALQLEDVHLKSFISLTVAISLTHWTGLARVTRGLVMEAKRFPYVEAARALGIKPLKIISTHIFPNIRGRIFSLAAMQVSTNIMYESFMSFIGLGIRSPWTSWGLLVQEGWKTMSSFEYLILYPSLVLFITVWSLNVVADSKKY